MWDMYDATSHPNDYLTLYVLICSDRVHRYICILYTPPPPHPHTPHPHTHTHTHTLGWRRQLKVFLMRDKYSLYPTANAVVVDDMATQGARESAAMDLIQLSRNISASAVKGLIIGEMC